MTGCVKTTTPKYIVFEYYQGPPEDIKLFDLNNEINYLTTDIVEAKRENKWTNRNCTGL